MEERSRMTEKLWGLTLEILRLLTREAHPEAKPGDHVTLTVAPPCCLPLQRPALRKILELTQRMAELLAGEMERPLQVILEVKVKEEAVIGEVGYLEASGDPSSYMKVKSSGVRSPPGECREGSAAKEPCKEEESSHIIGAECKTEDEDSSAYSPVRTSISRELHPDLDAAHPPSESENWHSVTEDPHPGLHHTAQRGEFTPNQTNHAGEKPYSCPECGKCFSQKSAVISHVRVHKGQKPHSCSECGKCFFQEAELLRHERLHTGKKPYSCSICGKCFSRNSNLLQHTRYHTGEGLYSCSVCGKCFIAKSKLTNHERIHTGEKPYSCSECGRCFSQKSHLIEHESVHTGKKPYSCSECRKSFSQKSNLISHERVHTGEKPYSCSDCGKCFYQKSDLNRHKRVHTGEKPFPCPDCGKGFTARSALSNHKKKVHTKEALQD